MRWVYGFDQIDLVEEQVDGWDGVKGLLGGKGANLAEMTRLGVPVPPGFTITTQACNAYLDAGDSFPEGLEEQVSAALAVVEERTGKRLGDAERPLLVSCRSGAKFSMPGMMDTVLNIGVNDDVVAGMRRRFGDDHFVFDSYRRLIQMFATVVIGIKDEPFELVLEELRERGGVGSDTDLTVSDLEEAVARFKAIVERFTGRPFPADPSVQLHMAIEAVFGSWNGKRAVDYRNAAGIAHDLGTAVNVQAMVFGNMGDDSATGVAMSRNATTGEPRLEGDYLVNAQGEDVVAGTRLTKPISGLADEMPEVHAKFAAIAATLESHYRDMQDMEFTIEHGTLWVLQTRDGKRTAQAAVRIAVDLTTEGVISRDDALRRVRPEHVDFFLHPQFEAKGRADAAAQGALLATGLNVSPGAGVGIAAFDPDLAERWAKEGKPVILARPETKPDDVHGMLAAEAIVTTRGGRTSHAALVARQFGKPAVVGASALSIDLNTRVMTVGERAIAEGDWLSIDGTTGEVFAGRLETRVPDIDDPWLERLLSWADERRRLQVWANADYPQDAARAKEYGAQGIGLCRTEHMFFEQERLPIVQKMITAQSQGERTEALASLLPLQRADFAGLFRVMAGLPVVIRLLDPPLHEFLPSKDELVATLTDRKLRLSHAGSLEEMDRLLAEIEAAEHMLERVEALHEANPMLGLRGVRLGIVQPGITRMQVRAIFEAAIEVTREGVPVHPEIMIPLTSTVSELATQRAVLEEEAKAVMAENEMTIDYAFGTMIEVPRAALTSDEIATQAEFISFGTNDLTQMTYGMSRDDAEAGFLIDYLSRDILSRNPFASIDERGVGRLMEIALVGARKTRPDIHAGICGEHGGDPDSIAFCHRLGLDYVSCSPFRVPVARLAAAQAVIAEES